MAEMNESITEMDGRITETNEPDLEARENSSSSRGSSIESSDEAMSEDLTHDNGAQDVTKSRPAAPPGSSSHGRFATHFTEEELNNVRRYKMNHAKRGPALIFNHEIFSNGLSNRIGATEDSLALSITLGELGFDVRIYNDLKRKSIMKILSQVARENHTDSDCLFVAIMTHGEDGGTLYASDYSYKDEEVMDIFKSKKVKGLEGKPKIFLFQACRGNTLEESTTVYDTTDFSPGRIYSIPSSADILVVHSTTKGHYSWRNISQGSWFIQDLCEELKIGSRTMDILSILTNTLRRVALTRSTSVPGNQNMDRRQQMPVFFSTLTKFLYFYETYI